MDGFEDDAAAGTSPSAAGEANGGDVGAALPGPSPTVPLATRQEIGRAHV